MRGFDDKALILFPKLESYEHRPANYKFQFNQAVSKLIQYLDEIGMVPHAFYTDDVARSINIPGVQWVNTLGFQDKYFASKHCQGMSNFMNIPMIEYEDIYNAVIAKDPWQDNMSEVETFNMLLRHETKALSKIIPMYKVVIHFMVKGNPKYKVTSKPADGKIRIIISAGTFIPTVYMSGNEENACDVLGKPYANRALDVWEV